jgi:hypothetical protein
MCAALSALLLPVPVYAPPHKCALPPHRSKHYLAHRVPGRAPCPSALLWCADARTLTLTFLVPVPLCLQVHGAGMILDAWRKVLLARIAASARCTLVPPALNAHTA